MDIFVKFTCICFVGFASSQPEWKSFHVGLSEGCVTANVSNFMTCPMSGNSTRWKAKRQQAASPRFATYAKNGLKCYYKLRKLERSCGSIPTCVMSTSQYVLPKPPQNTKPSCGNSSFSIETGCQENGPGGPNTKAVYSECFQKGQRSYCAVNFESCKLYKWTKFKVQCFVPCVAKHYSGFAKRVVRICKKSGGGVVDEKHCDGGVAASTATRSRCLRRSADGRECPNDTTQSLLVTTADTVPALYSASTEIMETTSNSLTQSTRSFGTRSAVIQQTTTSTSTDGVTQSQTLIYASYNTSISDELVTKLVPLPKILLPHSEASSSQPNVTLPPLVGISNDLPNANTFDLLAVAGGAGAGLLFILLLSIIIIILVRRKDHKSTTGNSIISSTSSYRSKGRRNPVVDSSSFRIATWIRERPSLPDGASISPSESVVSDAEYWKVGESVDDLTARYVKDSRDGDGSHVPDVVRNSSYSVGEEHIYDEVPPSDVEASASQARAKPIAQSSPKEPRADRVETVLPLDKHAVYAVVQKAKRREQQRKRLSTASVGGARRRIASQHSVTNLNGRHLRDGVLQIEFDDQNGVKCKLSDSDIYIDLDEAESPPVF